MAVKQGQVGVKTAVVEKPISKEYLKRKAEGTNNPHPCRPPK
jgi:hypothetical protein